jgi:TfoX/Sxy family transcriptional regulator of competence genes
VGRRVRRAEAGASVEVWPEATRQLATGNLSPGPRPYHRVSRKVGPIHGRCLVASSAEFVDYVLEKFDPGLDVTARKMFGEYGLFSGGRMFGLICDDRFFIKPTEEGRAFAGPMDEDAPYPGAKPCLLVEDRVEDRPWLSELTRITVAALPAPRKRKKNAGDGQS